jgi:hypothetical protein
MQLKRRMVTEEEKLRSEKNIAWLENYNPVTEDMNAMKTREVLSMKTSFINRNKRALERYESQKTDPTQPHLTHVVRIGDICFATNRFELYQDYMHRMQARSPFLQTFTVQMAGTEESCYLATERGIQGKGYSASLFCNQIGAEGGQQLVEETLAILNEMKAKD